MPLERRRIVLTWDHLVDIEPGLRVLEGRAQHLYEKRFAWYEDEEDLDDEDEDEDEDDREMREIAHYVDDAAFTCRINTVLVHYVGPGSRHPSLRSSEVYDIAYAHLMAVYTYGLYDPPEQNPQATSVHVHEDSGEL